MRELIPAPTGRSRQPLHVMYMYVATRLINGAWNVAARSGYGEARNAAERRHVGEFAMSRRPRASQPRPTIPPRSRRPARTRRPAARPAKSLLSVKTLQAGCRSVSEKIAIYNTNRDVQFTCLRSCTVALSTTVASTTICISHHHRHQCAAAVASTTQPTSIAAAALSTAAVAPPSPPR